MVRWLEIWRATTAKRRAQNKQLMRHPARGLNLDSLIIQEAHAVPWIGAQASNTDIGLATPGDAPSLCRRGWCPGNFASMWSYAHVFKQLSRSSCIPFFARLSTWDAKTCPNTTYQLSDNMSPLSKLLDAPLLWKPLFALLGATAKSMNLWKLFLPSLVNKQA